MADRHPCVRPVRRATASASVGTRVLQLLEQPGEWPGGHAHVEAESMPRALSPRSEREVVTALLALV
ncbi:MAG: hypothetical protein KKA32_13690 [Actinobacteria bacterium]|nr:hypothetical protein [Actinomycetota bacterium]